MGTYQRPCSTPGPVSKHVCEAAKLSARDSDLKTDCIVRPVGVEVRFLDIAVAREEGVAAIIIDCLAYESKDHKCGL